ncbi:hypothetical protein HDR63_04080 [bacterium]|nr:hypothetical protein [bacterium]
MKKIMLFLGLMFICPAHAANLDDGEVCINSMQCSSKACVKQNSDSDALCTHKAIMYGRCSPQSIYGVYFYPPCERGLSCEGKTTLGQYPGIEDADFDSYGWCLDVDASVECETCNLQTEWRTHSAGYQVRKTGTCLPATCEFIAEYRCDAGYYGNPGATASGCTKCPNDRTRPIGAPSLVQCYLAPNTYTDTTGTFDISANCFYTL